MLQNIIKGLLHLKVVLFFSRVAVALMNVANTAIGVGTFKRWIFSNKKKLLATGGAVFLAFKGIMKCLRKNLKMLML